MNFAIVILGDLNCNLLHSCPEANQLLDFITTFTLTQLVTKPTRITDASSSLIDVIMITDNSIVSSSDVLTCSISDHNLVYVILTLRTPRVKPSYVTTRSFANHDAEQFCKDLALVPFHVMSVFDDFEDQVDTFNILFADILEAHAPIRRIKIKSKPNPYVTPEIRQLMKTRDKWHKKAIKTNDRFCWNAFKFFRQEVKRELRLAEKAHVQSEIIGSKGNTNAIWKIINRCLPRKSKILPNINDNPTNLADKFNEYFTSVGSLTAQKAYDLAMEYDFNSATTISPPATRKHDECPDDFQFHAVTEQEVGKVIKGLSLNKAPGHDKITARVLKDSLPAILSVITSIMNNSFSTSTFPKAWKMAEVVPVLKSGCFEDPCNNRPISLLPILSKVSEKLAHRQFVDYITTNKKLSEHQSGNRKFHSTETALLHVTDDFLMSIDKSEVSAVVLLDMHKAFDSVRHDILLQKLQQIGITSSSLEWFHSYLSGRSQSVRIVDAVSASLPLKYGVPQGSILGPVLFTIYVNDLLAVPGHCKSVCYVDDSKLYLSFRSTDISYAFRCLNEDLREICRWCCQNSLLINPEKTKVLLVGVPQLLRKLPPVSISLLGKEITPVSVAKDLGVLIDQSLTYNDHVAKTTSNCLFKLKQISRIKHLLDRNSLLLVMNAFVFSKLFYCSTVWANTSQSNVKKLQLVQNFAARIVLGLRKYDHISDGIRSLNWLTVKDRLLLNDAVMVYKCLNNLVPKYLANIFVSRSQIHTRATRSCNLLHIPLCRLSYGQRSFTYRGCKLWNSICNDLKAADSVKCFRRRLAQKLLSGGHLCSVNL